MSIHRINQSIVSIIRINHRCQSCYYDLWHQWHQLVVVEWLSFDLCFNRWHPHPSKIISMHHFQSIAFLFNHFQSSALPFHSFSIIRAPLSIVLNHPRFPFNHFQSSALPFRSFALPFQSLPIIRAPLSIVLNHSHSPFNHFHSRQEKTKSDSQACCPSHETGRDCLS